MQIYEGRKEMYQFKILPHFAKYILENKLIDYINEVYGLLDLYNVPLLRYFKDWDEHKRIEYSKFTSSEFLTFLANNAAKQQINDSLLKWLNDQLGILGKYDISAQDITLIFFIRGRSLKKFIPQFTNDIHRAIELVDEIDTFNMGEVTSSTETYIAILKDKIEEEVYFNNKITGTLPGIIYVYDIEKQKAIYSNNKGIGILGYAPFQNEKNVFENIIHPDDFPGYLHHLEACKQLKDGETISIEVRMKQSSGKFKWTRIYQTIFRRREDGKATQFIGIAFDISDEKSISENLKKREEQLVEAQEIANTGSFEWHLKELTTYNSLQFYKIFEYNDTRHFNEFMFNVHVQDKEKVTSAFKEALKTGNYECEYRYLANGKEKFIWSKGKVLFENGEPFKMVGTIQDITERKKIEESLREKTMELERSNRDLMEFTYVASHDLKEPLRKISTYSDFLLSHELYSLTEKGQAHLRKIIESSVRMRKLIDDILAVSTVTHSKVKEYCSLQKLFEDCLLMLEHNISQKRAVISSDGLPMANVTPSLFQQLFQNLITNSLKFCRPDVRPEISVTHRFLDVDKTVTENEEVSTFIEIIFADNGIGFNNEFSEKIFSLFQRLHSQTEYEGTGMGLAICKKIVEEHGGNISASSEPGKGAKIILTIPR